MSAPVKGDAGLVRVLNRWDLVALVINGIVGAGIFGLPAKIDGKLGSWGLFAIGACAVIITLIILCFAEVSSRFTETGGPYVYARTAFGPFAGFQAGWLLWLARLTGICAICNLFVQYLTFFLPSVGSGLPRTAVLAFVILGLTALHLRGVRQAALFGRGITIAKLVPLIVFVAVGLFYIDGSRVSFATVPTNANFSSAVLLLGFAFVGWESVVVSSGETQDPRKDTPFALLSGIALVAVLYTGIQLVCIGTLPGLANSERPIADASRTFLGGAGASVIVLGALVSMIGTLNGSMLTVSRLPFAMADAGELPSILAAVHPRWRTPYISIVFCALIILGLTLTSTYTYVLTVSTIARLLVFVVTIAALPVLRKRTDVRPATFTLAGGLLVPARALVFIAWLLVSSSQKETRDVAIAAVVGVLVWGVMRGRVGSRASAQIG